MRIDGINIISQYGFHPQQRLLPRPAATNTMQQVQGRPGGRRNGGNIGPGTLSVSGHVVGSSATEARVQADSILALCKVDSGIPLVLSFPDIPDREWVGYADASEVNDVEKWGMPVQQLSLVFALDDVVARHPEETALVLSSGVVTDLVLGSFYSLPRVEIEAPEAFVRIEVLNGNNSVLSSLDWENPGTGAGTLVIDAAERTARRGGVSVVDGITEPSLFPVFDPAWGAARVRVTGGTGITCYFRRRFWR